MGEDVENILLRLIQAADWDIHRAERGIIYIDEMDKIARKEGVNRSITRDVSGEGVQQELLKIIEGCVANVPPQGGRKHPHQEFLQINTSNILFICGGAFDGLEQVVEKRSNSGTSRLGFLAGGRSDQANGGNLMSNVTPDDLLEFGFIPEMVGRLPVTVALDPLDRDSLVRVLVEPKNAIVKQYQHLFLMDGVGAGVHPRRAGGGGRAGPGAPHWREVPALCDRGYAAGRDVRPPVTERCRPVRRGPGRH